MIEVLFDRAQRALQNDTSQGTPRGHNRLLEGVLRGYVRVGGGLRGGGSPPGTVKLQIHTPSSKR